MRDADPFRSNEMSCLTTGKRRADIKCHCEETRCHRMTPGNLLPTTEDSILQKLQAADVSLETLTEDTLQA